jgi:hypothetical protein
MLDLDRSEYLTIALFIVVSVAAVYVAFFM